jgi:hypothetical protein
VRQFGHSLRLRIYPTDCHSRKAEHLHLYIFYEGLVQSNCLGLDCLASQLQPVSSTFTIQLFTPRGCLTTGPQPLPHTSRSGASTINLHYPVVSLRSSSSCLRLLPRLLVTLTLPSIFPLITCFRRQQFRYPSSQFPPAPPPKKLVVSLITANSTTCHKFLSGSRCHTSFHYCNQHAHYTYCSIHCPAGSRKVLDEKTVQQRRHKANLLHALSSQKKV